MTVKKARSRIAAAAALVLTSSLLVAGAAGAHADTGALTISPAPGTNMSLTQVDTPQACSPGASHLQTRLVGTGFQNSSTNPAVQGFGYNISSNAALTSLPNNAAGGKMIPLLQTFQQAADAQVPPAPLTGIHTLTTRCKNASATSTIYDEFTISIDFPSPTTYTIVSTPLTATTTAITAVAPASPRTVGTLVTFSGTVDATPGNPTGSIQLQKGTANLGASALVENGVFSVQVAAPAAGAHSITAVFTPISPTFAASTSAAVAYTTTVPTPTTTTLALSPASPQEAGTSLSLMTTVSPASAVGTVQFKSDGSNFGGPIAVSGGAAALTSTALSVGAHSLTATFIPADTQAFATSTSAAADYTITAPTVPAENTTTALAVTPASPRSFSTPITLSATISPVAAGTVQFKNAGVDLGTAATVNSGVASMTTTTLPEGSHTLQAVFTPTDPAAYNGSSSSTVPFVVTAFVPPADTALALTVTPEGPQFEGTPLTLQATVSPAAPGTVQFKVGASNLGAPAAVAGGSAQLVTSSLAVGTHALSAVFTSTSLTEFNGSTAVAVSYTVIPRPVATATTLSVAPIGTALLGAAITLEANVSNGGIGNVQFKYGSTSLGSAPVIAGKATRVTTDVPLGTHSLTAMFSPSNANLFALSTSGAISLTVKPVPVATVTTLSAAPAGPRVQGTSISLTATVTPAAAGSVQFRDGDADLGTAVTVTDSTANVSTTTLTVGAHNLTAVFTPTDPANFVASTSAGLSFSITATPLPVVVAPPVVVTPPVVLGPPVVVPPPAGTPARKTPVNTSQPLFKGKARAGGILTCSAGAWTNADSFLYQWLRDGKLIPRATTVSYTLSGLDFKHVIACQVTGKNVTGTAIAVSAGIRVGLGAYRAMALPLVKGQLRAGTPLAVVPATWSSKPGAMTYQWYRSGVLIRGAVKPVYVVLKADLGKSITVTIKATGVGFAPGVVSSRVLLLKLPSVAGRGKAAQLLTVSTGSWTPTPTTFTFAWYRDGKLIKGATKSSYRLTAADKGRRVTARVTARRGRVVLGEAAASNTIVVATR